MNNKEIKQDCRLFRFDRPCRPHKDRSIVCHECGYYSRIDKRILIIKLDALGDVLRTMSILPPLKKKYPNSHITWVTRTNALPLFKNVDLVDEVIDYSNPMVTHLLQTVNFDLVLNPDANKAAALLASCAHSKEKKGFTIGGSGEIIPSNKKAYEWFLMGINDDIKKRNTNTYQKIIYGILDLDGFDGYIPLNLNNKETERSSAFRQEFSIDDNSPVIGLNIGASGRWQNKVWPINSFQELITILLKMNWQVVLLGGPEEKESINILMGKYQNRVISGGYNNTLRAFFSILNACDILVSSDTMAAHAGLALGKKVVVLLGPTSINEFDVYGSGIKLSANMDCLACYRPSCDKKPNCMDQLTADKVLKAILKLQTGKN